VLPILPSRPKFHPAAHECGLELGPKRAASPDAEELLVSHLNASN